jgi:flagellar protein FlgJ
MDVNALTAFTDLHTNSSIAANKLNKLNNTDFSQSSDEKLLEACKEFEAYFLEMVFKEMQKSVKFFSDDKDQSNSQLVDYFRDTTIQKIAADATETQGLGLAQQLFEQMKRNYNL